VIGVSDTGDISGARQRRTFRSAGQVVGSTVFSLGIMAVTVAKVLHASNAGARVIGWVVVGFLAILAIRTALWSVTASADGVRVRGVIRTRTLRWSEIDHFSLGRLGFFPAVGIAHRKRGRPLAMSAIEVTKMSTVKGRAGTQTMITELNRLLAEHHGSGEPRAEA
jgi:hypothetical protein